MSLFTQNKQDRDIKVVKANGAPDFTAPAGDGTASTLGRGMQVTGNIVCAGALQVFGRVTGDIHAAQLTIGDGGKVEGNVLAGEAIIRGEFKGALRGNAVRLQGSAVVEGEIFNGSLAIDQDARFEGVARRLDKAVEAPAANNEPTLKAVSSLRPVG